MWITSSLSTILTPTAVALGNFDGIHQGHRQVIQPALAFNDEAIASPVYATVVTFHPHPQEFFSGQSRKLLTPLPEKIVQLDKMGVKQLVMLPFDQQLATLTPAQFVQEILLKQLQVRQISIGSDFRFGRNRAGTAKELQAIAAAEGVEVMITSLKLLDEKRISSSAIREALQAGDIALANYLLGRPYTLVGTVVEGQQLGNTLGFPTANLQLPPEKCLPRSGVYAVRVQWCEKGDCPQPGTACETGVMNLGYRPTVNGTHLVAEVHLLNWAGNLYGQVLSVSLEHFLRPEQKFESLNALKAQIKTDCDAAKTVF
ncbi:bifunctional riboflavin kinase/FAD synthetase [Phormidium sp. CLA17]|uniref:bifunctional riboflavin kinase/FAD synthetase n=1 Tax=Leptolyngbya sp. Cla-17 TaxID=2803751 RepID=UPI001490B107|nr:bifunctional riboflavin kinase/FAD synthetase [Leptolyngbya sp. Cla-17]MBM0742289.1 bifunctional riboflavin kinase/FAD synthetase [Leptolyngbya sp. Cla-17]